MALIETITLGLGTGIAKGAFKVWLKDMPVLEQGVSSLLDLISSSTKNVLVERKLNREFEKVAELTASALYQVIRSEDVGVSEKRAEIVANAAGDLVSNTKLTSDLLLNTSLKPDQLEIFFLERTGNEYGNPGINFNEEEKLLFIKLISEASQMIIDLSRGLPGFNELIASESLGKIDTVEKVCQEILTETQRIRDHSSTGDRNDRQFETDYRREIIRHNDTVQMFGVDGSESSRRYNLSVAYVALEVDVKGTDQEESELDIEGALLKSNRLTIRGGAGSGKTTLLQWLCVNVANASFGTDRYAFNRAVPFLIRVRNYADGPLPKLSDFVLELSPFLSDIMPKEWAQRKFKEGLAIVMVDGLDEVSPKRRDEFRKWLTDLINIYPKCEYIVTMRPHAVKSDWLEDLSFVEATILDLDSKRIKSFINHWHNSVALTVSNKTENVTLEFSKSNLIDTIMYNRVLFRLARSPLLCALLCVLNRDRSGSLPQRKVDIYSACISLFFRRDSERKINPVRVLLDEAQVISVVSGLAIWMVRNGLSQCPYTEALDVINRSINQLNCLERPSSKDMMSFLVERCGILRVPQADTVDFPHKTFLEYFAARTICEEVSVGELIQHVTDDRWREIIVLSGSLLGANNSEELIKGIYGKLDEDPSLVIIAAATLDSVLSLPEDSNSAPLIREALSAVVPPNNRADAEAISAAGDYVVPYLPFDKRSRFENILCIDTLQKVGTEAAFEVLKSYLQSDDSEVGKRLSRAYENYNIPIAQDAVLFRELDSIRITLRIRLSPEIEYLFAGGLNIVEIDDIPPLWWVDKKINCKFVEVAGNSLDELAIVLLKNISIQLDMDIIANVRLVTYALAAIDSKLNSKKSLFSAISAYKMYKEQGGDSIKFTPVTRNMLKIIEDYDLDPTKFLKLIDDNKFLKLPAKKSEKHLEICTFFEACRLLGQEANKKKYKGLR